MPNIDRHAPGTFSWIELATSDQDAANKFYAELFGYQVNQFPIGGGQLYTIFRLDGRDAGACYTMMDDEKKLGIRSHWNLYVAVENTDESAKRAGELGGKIIAQPFNVMDAGRMAVIQDPTGVIFQLWQANRSQGIGIAGVAGTLCWADLNTRDTDRAKQFYEALFGWTLSPGEKDMSGYLHIKSGDEFIGGAPPATLMDPNTPPHWMIYLFAEDIAATANRAKELGAKVLMTPMKIQDVGEMAVIEDPQGAIFALFAAPKATA
jgi:uncharacterized protein